MTLVAVEFSILAHFVLYSKEALLFGVVSAGLFLAAVELGGAFGKPISGLISDRVFHGGRKSVYLLMVGVAFVMCLLFSFLQQGIPWWIIVPVSSILGLVAIGFGGLHLTLVGEIAGRELAGTVIGVSAAISMAGSIIGPPVFGYIVDTTGSYRLAWQLLALLAAVAAVLLLFVREEKRRI
jgi:MFS family permease